MRISTLKALKKLVSHSAFITCAFFLISNISHAQIRNYSIVYSENLKGNSIVFGNTLLNIVDYGSVNTTKMNGNSVNGNSTYGNDNENMQYADIDGNTGTGSVTRNSSSSDLVLPAGTNNIKFARLYWGGRVLNSEFDLTQDANKKIKIRKGNVNIYADVTASGMDKSIIINTYTQYQAYADITSFVQSNGAGTYEVGNVPLSTGAVDYGGYNGGWCIVVVYENANSNYNSIRVYDGFLQVYNGGNAPRPIITLTGLNVPSGALTLADAKMSVLAWEGDANVNKDFLKINGTLFSNATNPADNPWNGSITDNGVNVTTKNPDYTNQMGVDIDQFQVGTGYGISPNDTTVRLEFGTGYDQYFPGLFIFSIKMKDPVLTINNTVADANNNSIPEKNEVLTYTLKGKNNGAGNANSVVITDTLPSTISYLPNSLKVISSPGITTGILTDASGDDNAEYIVNGSVKTIKFSIGTGSTSTSGGTLAANDSYEVQFQAIVNDPGTSQSIPSILNIARIKGQSDANVNFVDDGTAILYAANLYLNAPEAGPLPVTLVSFTAILQQDDQVKLNWSTSMETNCSKYIIERSQDGKTFNQISTVAGNGTTSTLHSYSSTDNVSSITGSIAYYRLRQLDIDGKGNYSKVIVVKVKKANTEISISPNPFSSYLNMNMEWNTNEQITARVINSQGIEILSKNIQMSKGLNYVSMDQLSKLPAGNYFIQFVSSAEKITKRITKL